MTSLAVPLSAISANAEGELVLFAASAGAFVDLAADLAYATGTELDTFAFDSRLDDAAARPVSVGGVSVIHRAVGVLINAGYTPEQAQAPIADIAGGDHHDLAAAAQRMIYIDHLQTLSWHDPGPPAAPRQS